MYKPKNIIVCLDGTGNQIEENISNALKFYRTLDRDGNINQKQVSYYDQGVGTIGQQSTWGVASQKISSVWKLATGHGLDQNVLRAYRFLVRNYHEETTKDKNKKTVVLRDKIFLFGYSRGAHTARVLAGFIYNMGLLRPEQIHLSGAALTAYKRASTRKSMEETIHFNKITRPVEPSIEFMGLWDTVSSMITPRKDRFLIPALEELKNTAKNPIVKSFRHAISIDENRRMFREDDWDEPQEFKPNFHSTKKISNQDILQVWFPGFHGDVGGGNKKDNSGISQYSLCWMIKESKKFGLLFNTRMVDYVALGIPYTKNTVYNYPKPDHMAPLHGSKKSGWAILEILPKLSKFREKPKRVKRLRLPWTYIPWWEPRSIPENSYIHESAINRSKGVSSYKPVNLPKNYSVIKHDGRRSKHW